MTFACLYGCRHAKLLAREICDSLMKDEWATESVIGEPASPKTYVTALTRGEYTILLLPACLRVFDRVFLFCHETEVWLPFLTRCKLRSCARAQIAIKEFAKLDIQGLDADNAMVTE